MPAEWSEVILDDAIADARATIEITKDDIVKNRAMMTVVLQTSISKGGKRQTLDAIVNHILAMKH